MKTAFVPGLMAALALSGCAAAYSAPETSTAFNAAPAVDAEKEPVTFSMPDGGIDLEGAAVLSWDDATRADNFRRMEDFFPGYEVQPAAEHRVLASGAALPADTIASIDAYMMRGDIAGIMVLQNGLVRYEKYGMNFGPEQRWTSFSVAKSLTSTLLGAAVKDGFIASLDDPVSKYIRELAGSAYDDVTVEQLATMTSGVKWDESYTDPSSDVARMFDMQPGPGEDQVVEYMKTLPREAPAGEKWVYKTGETNLIGVLVENAVDMKLAEYAKNKLVDPAGLAQPLFWQVDLSQRNIGGCCLSMALSDYARIGQFALEGGKGVVPEGWFDAAGAPQVDFGETFGRPGFGYGYQWWTYPGGNFGAQGIFGQSITIAPSQNMVVAILSNWPKASDSAQSAERLELLAAISAGAGAGD